MALRIAADEPELVLYGFLFSHPCVSVQLMLDRKHVPYRYKRLTPGLHPFLLIARGFPGRTVPAMRIGGARVQGSRMIAAELEQRFPEPPLFPAEKTGRRQVEEAEWSGEELQNAARRIAYFHLRRGPEMLARQLRPDHAEAASTRLAARALVTVASTAHGASDKRALADLEALPERLAQIEDWLHTGILGGAEPNAADFQIAPSLRMLRLFPDVAARVERDPLAGYADMIVPEYPPPPPN